MTRWQNLKPDVPWCISTISLLIALNRAAAFDVAARWVLHDLRSPAQSLTLMADLIAEPSEDLEEILREACGHMARSLDLLSRVLHPPAATDEPGPISVREPIAYVADLQRAGRTHIRIEVAVDAALPAAGGAGRHLEHALLNLILYATDSLRPRDSGAVIRVGAWAGGDEVHISVAWDGDPISPELELRLFEATPELATGEQPLSIGLPVAAEVIRRSGGTLRYANDRVTGPCFVISLPQWIRAAPARPADSR